MLYVNYISIIKRTMVKLLVSSDPMSSGFKMSIYSLTFLPLFLESLMTFV